MSTEIITDEEYNRALSIVKKYDKQRQTERMHTFFKHCIPLPIEDLKVYIPATEERIKSYSDMLADMHKNKANWSTEGFEEFKADIREVLNDQKIALKDLQEQAYWAKIYDNSLEERKRLEKSGIL